MKLILKDWGGNRKYVRLPYETFFEKDGTAENGDVVFEIGDTGTSVHLYWRLKKYHADFKKVSAFLLFFW